MLTLLRSFCYVAKGSLIEGVIESIVPHLIFGTISRAQTACCIFHILLSANALCTNFVFVQCLVQENEIRSTPRVSHQREMTCVAPTQRHSHGF